MVYIQSEENICVPTYPLNVYYDYYSLLLYFLFFLNIISLESGASGRHKIKK